MSQHKLGRRRPSPATTAGSSATATTTRWP